MAIASIKYNFSGKFNNLDFYIFRKLIEVILYFKLTLIRIFYNVNLGWKSQQAYLKNSEVSIEWMFYV